MYGHVRSIRDYGHFRFVGVFCILCIMIRLYARVIAVHSLVR